FLYLHISVGDDNEDITYLYFSGSGSVEAHNTGVPLSCNSICLKAFSVIHIYNLYFLALDYTCSFQQCFINCDAAYIVELGFGNRRSVNFPFKYLNHHLPAKLRFLMKETYCLSVLFHLPKRRYMP